MEVVDRQAITTSGGQTRCSGSAAMGAKAATMRQVKQRYAAPYRQFCEFNGLMRAAEPGKLAFDRVDKEKAPGLR